MNRALFGVCVGLTLGSCSSNQVGTTAGRSAKQIGPEGGSVALPDGSRVDVPAGALAAAVNVTIAPDPGVTASAPGDWAFVGTPYLLGPEGQQFSKPVTLTLAFDPGLLPADAPANDLWILTSLAGGTPDYTPLPITVVDASHVTAQTTHFSIFVVASEHTKPCGTVTLASGTIVTARIPASAVCCDTSGNYCAGNPAGAASPAACLDNPNGMCNGSNPLAASRAAHCCTIGGGSYDCPAQQYHCGLQCSAASGGCVVRGAQDAGPQPPPDGSPNAAAMCLNSSPTPTQTQTGGCNAPCCNALVSMGPNTCACILQPGTACHSVSEPPTGGLACCNTQGGTAASGTVSAKTYDNGNPGGVSTCSRILTGSASCGNDGCASDADCEIGSTCQVIASYCTQPERDCVAVCTTASGYGPTSGGHPCCDGLIVGKNGAGDDVCGFPPGMSCTDDYECASQHCVSGATTSSCQ